MTQELLQKIRERAHTALSTSPHYPSVLGHALEDIAQLCSDQDTQDEPLRVLALDFEQWALEVAPHSYLEGQKAQSIRERMKSLTGLPAKEQS